jgi:chitinase
MKKLLPLLLLLLFIFPAEAQLEENTVVWPDHYYAPYVASYPNIQLAQVAEETGIRFFTMAFILGGESCNAAWMGVVPLDGASSYIYTFMQRDLPVLREMGGDIMASFGGAAGAELAQVCPDAESLAEQYQRVIDAYKLTHLDFDIEGDDIHEPEAIAKRSEAIALLEANNEQDLFISYTLPVLPTGLTDDGISVLESAIEHGVEVDVVNIMTMNFGESFRDKSMGENNILAAQSLFSQLQALYPDKDDAALWGMIGLTPMAGINDTSDIFNLEDAELVSNFAVQQGIRSLAIWSLERDQQCPYVNALAPDCSGVAQEPYAFSTFLNKITPEAVD